MDQADTQLAKIHANIAQACTISRRDVDAITLVAVSKTYPAEAITPYLEAGHRVYGENRIQEAMQKWPALREQYPDTSLHLIGQLQSNKAEDAVALFDCIHSLDRPSLLNALARAMDKADRRIPCFVQVNIGQEEQKGGCSLHDLPAFLASVREADIPLAGLMCIPPFGIEPAPFFALMAKLADENRVASGSDANGLSMGMSADYQTAITLGATHVRVGSALFGERG